LIDKDVILNKANKVDHHLSRIKEKRVISLEGFLADLDWQESILFNLQMAVQNCIDIAAHIISEEELGIAGSTNEMFYMLQENGYLSPELTENMVAAVGFRNLVVHEYGNIELRQVYQIAHQDIDDMESFLKAIIKKCDIA
jgi:uncharacterized protein YutE (UPF0331/DUF86 family)